MNGSARVHSIEVLQDFRAALCEFGQGASTALEEAVSEVQRVLMWLKLEQRPYWQGELRRRNEAYAQAKLALKRKRDLETSPLGGHYSYVDERKAVALAERRVAEAETRYRNVQRWAMKLEDEAFTFKTVLRGLLDTVELDLPTALSDIDAMVIALEKYLSVAPPAESAFPGEPGVASMTTVTEEAGSRQADSGGAAEAVLDYQSLRQRTPGAAERRGAGQSDVASDWAGIGALDEQQRRRVSSVAIVAGSPENGQRVVVARGVGRQSRVYIERVISTGPDDSGWFVGSALAWEADGGQEPAACEAISVGQLLQRRPDFAELLRLPAGFLVVLDSKGLEAIVNPAGKTLWQRKVEA